ncbi:MAG: hypothetical protein ACUVSJ_11810, partial [Anaerolineae bacterium]
IVAAAGFAPDRSITLVTDCETPKRSLLEFTDEDVQKVVQAILDALNEIKTKDKTGGDQAVS